MKAKQRLVSGASRVIAAIVESGWPGRLARSMASINRSTAARNAPVTSPTVRDTSAAVSIARAATLGWEIGSKFSSILTWRALCFNSCPATVRFPRPRSGSTRPLPWLSARAHVLNSGSANLWLSATGRRGERRATASKHECRGADFVPQGMKGLQPLNGLGESLLP